jgi:hypothetical protein
MVDSNDLANVFNDFLVAVAQDLLVINLDELYALRAQ